MLMGFKHSLVLVVLAPVPIMMAISLCAGIAYSAKLVEQKGSSSLEEWGWIEVQFVRWVEGEKVRVEGENKKQKVKHPREKRVILVDLQEGKGNFTSVQKAIDSIPNTNRFNIIIQINAGIYEEKVLIPRYKKYITMRGQGRENTIIVWNDTASGANSTYRSATVGIDAPNFTAYNITFQNSAPAQNPGDEKEQAVAARVSGDYAAFFGCGFLGHQDTLYDHKGKHYFQDCYIEGSIDFIFGNGLSFYTNSELHVVPVTPGSLTAQKRSNVNKWTGFSFMNCSITGSGIVYLGRAWGRYSRVVYLYTFMADIVIPQGWYDWGIPRRDETVYYGQYKCYGPGATEIARVPWSHELTDQESQPFLTPDFINGSTWLPYLQYKISE